ncbi:MAG TPA: anti-sigma factor [Pyrinomonadaceae bacterium]|nr:anti-sigma factor [Pyrinomonadaceae bacterium]
MRHEDYKEMLAAKALSALDADDAAALGIHLEQCPDCRVELDEWHETAALVALGANPSEPSLVVRERILTTIHAEVSQNIQPDSLRPGVDLAKRVLPFEQPRRTNSFSLGSFGTIAAALVMVAMIVGLLALWQQNRANRVEMDRMATRLREANEQLATGRALVALLRTPGSRVTELSGTNSAPGAHAMLAYDKTGHAMLMTKNLPAAPPGMAYQLWFIKDNKKMPGKVFTTDESGSGVLEDQIPNEALGSAVYAITLEPANGVQIPTGAIYLVSAS